MEKRNPDFIGIGFRRCGSSWLHARLNEHPEIGKPPNGLHFFSDHWGRGEEWYLKELSSHAEKKVLIEFSVSYSYPKICEQVARRIAETFPQAKVFFCLRHPVERAFSDYRRSLNLLEIPQDMSFEKAIEEYPEFLERGEYAKILATYLAHIKKENIYIMMYDDLVENPEVFLERLSKFLHIDPLGFKSCGKKELSPDAVRSVSLQRMVFGFKESLNSLFTGLGLLDSWEKFKEKYMRYYHAVLALNQKPLVISTATRKRLASHYSSEIDKMEEMFGMSFERWR